MEKKEIIAEIKKDMADTLEWGKDAAEGLREIGKKLDLKRLAKEKIFDQPCCRRPLIECEYAVTRHFEKDNEDYYFNMSYSMGTECAKWIDDFICEEYNDIYDQIQDLQEYLKVLEEAYSYTQDLVKTTNQLEALEMELSEYITEE